MGLVSDQVGVEALHLRWGEWKNNFHSAFRMPHSGKFPFRIRELFGTTVLTVGAIIHSECRILEKIHSALFHSPQRRLCGLEISR